MKKRAIQKMVKSLDSLLKNHGGWREGGGGCCQNEIFFSDLFEQDDTLFISV